MSLHNEGLSKIEQLTEENERLKAENARLRALLFGASKGEQVDRRQLEILLKLDECVVDEPVEENKNTDGQVNPTFAPKESSLPEQEADPRVRRRYVLPEHLEERTETIIPEEVQAQPEAYEEIGQPEVTELLDVVPMKVIKRRFVRPQFRHKGDRSLPPISAPTPPRVLLGGMAAPGLLVHIILAKYIDHLPLYRQEQIFKKRFDVNIPRKLMADWVGVVAEEWLGLIYNSIKSDLLRQRHLHADETPIKCQDPDFKGRTRQGYLWVYRSGNLVYYDWHMTRGRKAAESMLSGYTGLVQADGYAVYTELAKRESFTLLGCMAHARRKFYHAWKDAEEDASAWYLLQIQKLYLIEKELKGQSLEAVAQTRKAKSKPLLNEIKKALDADLQTLSKRTHTHQAVSYMLNQWKALTVYLEHPIAPIDNNPVEQAIRPTKLGAKNWLFVGHPEAGRRSAILYTILQNCELHGHNPQKYLLDVLQRLAQDDTNNPDFIASLTPKNWKSN